MAKPNKLILLGGGLGKQFAPYDGERWGVNGTCIGLPVHKSFHLHDLEHQEKYFVTGTDKTENIDFSPFLSYVKFTGHPVLSVKEYPDFPSIKRYPYEAICEYFDTNYFSNSFCYMIAYALWEGYTNIECYGFNFLMAGEYIEELPGVHFWLAIAHSRGLRMGKEFKIYGNMSKLFSLPERKNYSFEENLTHLPIPIPISIKPAKVALCA